MVSLLMNQIISNEHYSDLITLYYFNYKRLDSIVLK